MAFKPVKALKTAFKAAADISIVGAAAAISAYEKYSPAFKNLDATLETACADRGRKIFEQRGLSGDTGKVAGEIVYQGVKFATAAYGPGIASRAVTKISGTALGSLTHLNKLPKLKK